MQARMKWSRKIVTIAGIDIHVHATFFLLLLWVGFGYWQMAGTFSAVASGVSFVLAIFVCVVLHELGHALTARHYGIATQHITLLPIGGIAALERMPDDPRQEIWVALAGPAVNVAIAGMLWLAVGHSALIEPTSQPENFADLPFLERLMIANFMLATFNMLPALPMDGGRVFRAALATRMDHDKATEKAARVGRGIALCLGFIGLLASPVLVFIAVFVWIGAAAELHASRMKSALSGVTIGDAMLTDYDALNPTDRLSQAIELTLAGSQRDFPVMKQADPIGVLTQTDLLRGLQAAGDHALVVDWMREGMPSIDIDHPLEEALERFQGDAHSLLSVRHEGDVAGIINLENFLEYLSIHNALGQTNKP
jgi:Zn-dependent protease